MNQPANSLIVRLGADFNWWVDRLGDAPPPARLQRGILDPRQVQHLLTTVTDYQPYGLSARQITNAFRLFAIETELAEGCLRLAPIHDSLTGATNVFALPALDEDGDGPYCDFLDALGLARIRRLNATHPNGRTSTDDLRADLDDFEHERYFEADTIHAFDEITSILEWQPAD